METLSDCIFEPTEEDMAYADAYWAEQNPLLLNEAEEAEGF